MKIESIIRERLNQNFRPKVLEIENESHKHGRPQGAESHFQVLCVSDLFKNTSKVERHRKIYELLKEELATSIHALSLKIYTEDEWSLVDKKLLSTPPCSHR